MKKLNWQWLAIALLTLNILGWLIHILTVGAPLPVTTDVPPMDPNLPRLELVAELTEEPGLDSDVDRCFTIGPLTSLLAQQRAEDRLRPFANTIRSRQTLADRDRGWWVYLPAASRAEALEITRALAERGVEDYYVVTSGNMENTVSVGLYESIENARGRQSRVRALGFNAQMEVRREDAPQFWVDYRIAPGERSPWRFIVRASPGAQHREIPCFDN